MIKDAKNLQNQQRTGERAGSSAQGHHGQARGQAASRGAIDALVKRIYEDNVAQKISDERFAKLLADYESEQKSLSEQAEILDAGLAEQEEKAISVDKFLALVRKHTDIQELTPGLLREFIEKIIVCGATKVDGHREQEVVIHYNFVGTVGDIEITP